MLKLRAALDALTLANDGVDGKKIYLYGEGWNFGEVANNARGVNATQAQHGRHRHRHLQRPPARRRARRRPASAASQEQGFLTGLYYDPNATNQGSAGDQHGKLLPARRLDPRRAGGQPRRLPVRGPQRATGDRQRRSTTTASPRATPPIRRRSSTTSRRTTTRRCSTPSRSRPPGATRHGRPRADAEPGHEPRRASARASPSSTRASSCCAPSRSTATATTRATGSTSSTSPTARTTGASGLPPAPDNQSQLADPGAAAGQPGAEGRPAADPARAYAHFLETLAIRKSSPLFRLRTAADVQSRLRFYNTGPNQIPGVIVMSLAGQRRQRGPLPQAGGGGLQRHEPDAELQRLRARGGCR